MDNEAWPLRHVAFLSFGLKTKQISVRQRMPPICHHPCSYTKDLHCPRQNSDQTRQKSQVGEKRMSGHELE